MNPEQSITKKQLTREQQQLVNNHYQKAQIIANTFCTPFIGEGDLYGAAYEGLIHAAMNYDAAREASFATFMNKYVIGEILHTIRVIRGREEFSIDDINEEADSPDSLIEPSEDPSPEFENRDFIQRILDRITPDERTIIENLYGLNGKNEHSATEIAAIMGLSSTCIYQRIKLLMRKLTKLANQL